MRYHNIEKSGFRPREYIGYADGAWRIVRTNAGQTWTAYKNGSAITRKTLREISAALDVAAQFIARERAK